MDGNEHRDSAEQDIMRTMQKLGPDDYEMAIDASMLWSAPLDQFRPSRQRGRSSAPCGRGRAPHLLPRPVNAAPTNTHILAKAARRSRKFGRRCTYAVTSRAARMRRIWRRAKACSPSVSGTDGPGRKLTMIAGTCIEAKRRHRL